MGDKEYSIPGNFKIADKGYREYMRMKELELVRHENQFRYEYSLYEPADEQDRYFKEVIYPMSRPNYKPGDVLEFSGKPDPDCGCGNLVDRVTLGKAKYILLNDDYQDSMYDDCGAYGVLDEKGEFAYKRCCRVKLEYFKLVGCSNPFGGITFATNKEGEKHMRTRELTKAQETNLNEDMKALIRMGWVENDLTLANPSHFVEFLFAKYQKEYAELAVAELKKLEKETK